MKFLLFFIVFFSCIFANDLKVTTTSKLPAGQSLKSGLSYLNTIRLNLGLKQFSYSYTLQNASKNHTYYLQKENNGISHYETNTNNIYFTGKIPGDRAVYANHSTYFVGENIALMHSDLESSIDALLSAIYHRFGFLHYEFDEIGFFQASPYFVYLMSNSAITKLCKKGDSIKNYYLNGICKDKNNLISKEKFDFATKPTKPQYVNFPNEKVRTIAYFGGEVPDPLPQCKLTSPPVSIEFNPNSKIQLHSFKLFKDNKELNNTYLLHKNNDINAMLNERQFALFSLLPFDFNARYTASVEYSENGSKKRTTWDFMTKTPEYEYFTLRDGDVIQMRANKIYDLFFVPKNCNDIVKNMQYLVTNSDTKLNVKQISSDNLFRVSVNGKSGSIIKLNSSSHNITIIINN